MNFEELKQNAKRELEEAIQKQEELVTLRQAEDPAASLVSVRQSAL